MHSRVVLVSDDPNFFDFIFPKISMRKYDELYRFSFSEILSKIHLISTAVLIINSDSSKTKTLQLLQLFKNNPVIVFSLNEEDFYRVECLKSGAISLVTPLTEEEEFFANIKFAMSISSILQKNMQYREILVRKNLINPVNEVLFDYNSVLDNELKKISDSFAKAVLVAISPDDMLKSNLKQNQIETIILNNIRKNDILLNYADNKYFLLLYNTDVDGAEKIWAKIKTEFPEKIYAGFGNVLSKTRQQLVNEVLNKLHEAINFGRSLAQDTNATSSSVGTGYGNFKTFKKDYYNNIQKVVNPVFYHIRQKYIDSLMGVNMTMEEADGCNVLTLKSRTFAYVFKISAPGFSKINIDITFMSANNQSETKRIALNPEEFEEGLLEDLLEQFILEFKKEINDDNS